VNYWHLGRRVVKIGQKVKKGDIIAYVGHSGKYAEHTHIGFKKGRRLGSLWEEGYTTDPQPYFDRMELWSNLTEDPMKIAELEKKVSELTASMATMQSQIDMLSSNVNTLTIQLHDTNADREKWKNISTDMAQMLGYTFDPLGDWAVQKYGIRQKIEQLPYSLSVWQLFAVIINKFISKKK
jgi:septal ring factor EnvC (AmiA/AmiB activator)